MQFYNATTEDAICQEMDRICGSTVNTFSLKSKAARVNAALDRFYAIALENDSVWLFEDANNTDLPIGVANLASGQQDYSFASELLMLNKVLVADSAGLFYEITELEPDDERAKNIFTLPAGNSGTPSHYVIVGNSLLLDAIPNYNYTGGLKVLFKRGASKFASTDTTKEPGIPSLFHPYLCRQGSMPFLIEKKLPQKNDVAAQIVIDEDAIIDFMANRNKTSRPKIIPKHRNPR